MTGGASPKSFSNQGDMNPMKKKTLVATLALLASLLVTTNVFAGTAQCTAGVNLRFVGVGSSAQFNDLAYAASFLLQTTHGTGNYALISFKGSIITDKRPTPALTDTGLSTWVEWDPTATTKACDAYVYFQTDSGVGDKDFFAYESFTATNDGNAVFKSVAAAYATIPSGVIALGNLIGGLADNSTDPNGVPATIQAALNTTPEQYVNVASPPAALAYCGNVSTVAKTSQFYCYFNAAATDIRPEDALYAATRALTAYNGLTYTATSATTKVGTGTLTGLGYGTGAGCATGTTLVGCGVEDSFDTASVFNVVTFKLSGTDPIAGGTLPTYTTLSVGAAPQMVIVGHEDTSGSAFAFNATSNDYYGNSIYTFHNINRQILAQTFSGYTHCTGDLLPTGAATADAGQPMQVINREPLSGTYNTFEFTAVRTLSGSANPAEVTTNPISMSDSSQEEFNNPNLYPNLAGCTYTNGYPSANCFNPLFLNLGGTKCPGASGGTAPGLPVRLRSIGSGEEVKAVIGSENKTNSGSTTVFNPIGYAFWSYGNLNPLCSTVSGTSCTGNWLGHYMTVDGIDPLYDTPGGQYDPTPNPSGAFKPPVCDLKVGTTCKTIPFVHVKDGSYPLWFLAAYGHFRSQKERDCHAARSPRHGRQRANRGRPRWGWSLGLRSVPDRSDRQQRRLHGEPQLVRLPRSLQAVLDQSG